MKCVVLLPHGEIALGKLAQAMMDGATVIALRGNFDDALRIVREIGETLQQSRSSTPSIPSASRAKRRPRSKFAMCWAARPIFISCPSATPATSPPTGRAIKEYQAAQDHFFVPAKCSASRPQAPRPSCADMRLNDPQTIATAIRIGNPASWKLAETARDESGGLIDMVSDAEIIDAYKLLAAKEGVFVEPASAAGVAGLRKHVAKGLFPRGSVLAITLTGHGLKDPDTAMANASSPTTCDASADEVLKVIGI